MKVKVCLLCSILILLSGMKSLNAQTQSGQPQRLEIEKVKEQTLKTDSLPWAKNKINLTPISLFSTYHPGIELGYERLHGKRFATEYHFALLTSRDNEYARDTQGHMMGFELKYFHSNHERSRWYYALTFERLQKRHEAELFYTTVRNDDYITRSRDDYFSRTVAVDKEFFTMTLRVGLQHYLTPYLVLEGYIGAGVRYREVRHLNAPVVDGFHSSRDYEWLDIEYSSNRVASERMLKLDLNIRLAWAF